MNTRKLDELAPQIINKAYGAIIEMNADAKLRQLGVEEIDVNEALRPVSVQMAYYSRGRMSVEDVKKMYKAAGLYELSDAEAKTPNTQTLDSKHCRGLAVDIVPLKGGRVWWNASEDVWNRIGEIGKKNGLKWGGDWKGFRDCPHFEV